MFNPETFRFDTDDVTIYLAAAGSGKTTAIINRMVELLKIYRPDEIAFVTFTRKGVSNGIERALQANPGLQAEDLPHFKTLHALCFRELGLEHSAILQRKHMEEFNKRHKHHVYLRAAYEKQTNGDRLLTRYDAVRSGGAREELIVSAAERVDYARFVNAYEQFKQKHGLVDFYDCLYRFKAAGKPVGVKVAFIDEAQDLTALQWEVCRVAFSKCEKIVVAGDDYQTLFSHCGANPKVLIALARKYPAIKLEKSYRLPMAVYRLAKGIVSVIGNKAEKDFFPAKNVEGFVEDIHERNDLVYRIRRDMRKNGCAPGRWYLLFRNNCFMADVTKLLEAHVIPYHTARGFVIPEPDLTKLRRFYNYRKEGFGDAKARRAFCEKHRIKDINEDFTESDLIPSERRYVYAEYVEKHGIAALDEMAKREPFLLLSTTHRVKGGEADFVAAFMECTRRVAVNKMRNADEELRVLYVACTRSRLGLYIVQRYSSNYGLDRVLETVKELSA
jgi:superfamily I DNA/RNA helicase